MPILWHWSNIYCNSIANLFIRICNLTKSYLYNKKQSGKFRQSLTKV